MRRDGVRGMAIVATASVFVAGAVLAGEAVRSGPKVGEIAGPFEVRDITGPNKGKTLCYR